MIFIAGISAKVKEICHAKERTCPACGNMASLHISHHYLTPHLFFIPTIRLKSKYVATCPRCAAVMALRPERGRILEKDPAARILDIDLRL